MTTDPKFRAQVEALRQRAESEIADARLVAEAFAEENSGCALAASQAREDAWRTVLALLAEFPQPAEEAGSGQELHPAESVALTVALAQLLRGQTPDGNVAAMCVYGLARLAGRHDWITEAEATP